MNPRVLDIVLARIQLGKCTDVRPCVVLYPPVGDIVEVSPISSQSDMFNPQLHFEIDPTHPDFPATGLSRKSYVLDDFARKIKLSDIVSNLGRFESDLAVEFKDWYGL